MSKKTGKDYEEGLLERLNDPVYAAQYLQACLEEAVPDPSLRKTVFLNALTDVMRSHGMSKLAREAKLNRSNIYDKFVGKGNPSLDTVFKVLDVLGLRLSIEVRG